MPKRIQRKRTKGWRMPPNSVYVGRPTKWGNSAMVGRDGSAAQCVEAYRRRVTTNLWTEPTTMSVKDELRGKNLVCWCSLDQPCHADVLLEIANK